MKPKAPRDPISDFQRVARANRRSGQDRQCKCGEKRPLALIPGSEPAICAACHREERGRSEFDNHHPAGRANHPATIPIWVNDHRAELSPAQYDWPRSTWENVDGSPLLRGAACIRGHCETYDYLVAKLLLPNAELFEALDEFVTKCLGPRWWCGTELERFAPKRKAKRRSGP
jgi:hypothetical protein